MKTFMKATSFALVATVIVFLMTAQVGAAWPERPITGVVCSSAGGGCDTVSRTYAKAMEKHLGVDIKVINKPGGGGSLAMDFVQSKPADGYWWLLGVEFFKWARPMGRTNTTGWKDWQWYKCANAVSSWSVRSDSPFKTVTDLLDEARKHPNNVKMSYGCAPGGVWHEASALIMNETNTKFRNVHYHGGALATLACLNGEVDVVSSGLHEHIEFIRAGKLRNLVVFVKEPIQLKDGTIIRPVTDFVPGLAKWAPFGAEYTLAVKRGVPVEALEKIKSAFVAAVNSPEYDTLMKQRFFFKEIVVGGNADRMAALRESVTSWLLWDLKVEGVKANPVDLGIPRPEGFDTWWPPKGYKPRIKSD